MRARVLMFQGTGSDVGKSVIVAGLCRLFARRGLGVRPFKSQNMSNNAAVTPDGGEIGRAQALQARACGIAPSVDMNPVLLKPESDTRAQVIVRGKVLRAAEAQSYQGLKAVLLPAALESFDRLRSEADLVLVEGAGSPAEVNLREGDIANMGFAEAADIPVVLIGDIERGGVIAAMVGTWGLLPPSERERIKGTIINKFRGDVRLFDGGRTIISERTGWADCGVVPFFHGLRLLPSEDGIDLRYYERKPAALIKIAVPIFPRISNFDDFDPFNAEPDVEVQMIEPGRALPGDADLIILPGSKSTIADLRFLRQTGWDVDLRAHLRRDGQIVGICGGYQMLGRVVDDPEGVEGPPERIDGLGFLDVETRLTSSKTLSPVSGVEVTTGRSLSGYEMHMGGTEGRDCERPWLRLASRVDGAISRDGRVRGCYVHGLFAADEFRGAFLRSLRARNSSGVSYEARIDEALDAWANHLGMHLDVERLVSFAR
jgi:adenosylcobyric acid synthase